MFRFFASFTDSKLSSISEIKGYAYNIANREINHREPYRKHFVWEKQNWVANRKMHCLWMYRQCIFYKSALCIFKAFRIWLWQQILHLSERAAQSVQAALRRAASAPEPSAGS